jgi:hypothetical protein
MQYMYVYKSLRSIKIRHNHRYIPESGSVCVWDPVDVVVVGAICALGDCDACWASEVRIGGCSEAGTGGCDCIADEPSAGFMVDSSP